VKDLVLLDDHLSQVSLPLVGVGVELPEPSELITNLLLLPLTALAILLNPPLLLLHLRAKHVQLVLLKIRQLLG
jgi:hypothetical protein